MKAVHIIPRDTNVRNTFYFVVGVDRSLEHVVNCVRAQQLDGRILVWDYLDANLTKFRSPQKERFVGGQENMVAMHPLNEPKWPITHQGRGVERDLVQIRILGKHVRWSDIVWLIAFCKKRVHKWSERALQMNDDRTCVGCIDVANNIIAMT